MTDLEFFILETNRVLDIDFDQFQGTIDESRGLNQMSDKDVKIALLHIQCIITHQNELIKKLYKELGKKKSFFGRLFNK